VSVVSAATTVVVEGVTLTRSTAVGMSGPGGSGNLTKRWVEASITIGPSAVNLVGQAHTFGIAVVVQPSGAQPVTVTSITTSVTPEPTSSSNTCGSPTVTTETDGTVRATCTLTINSSVATTYTANATAVIDVGGATLTRSTDASVAPSGPDGSGPATKQYVAVLGEQVTRLPVTGGAPGAPLWFAWLLIVTGLCLVAIAAVAKTTLPAPVPAPSEDPPAEA
jgi:hypothetical protein